MEGEDNGAKKRGRGGKGMGGRTGRNEEERIRKGGLKKMT